MSAVTDHCLLCCTTVLKNAEKVLQNQNGHFGASIDLMTLCDILKVSVNEAENYLNQTVSLCLTCDGDITEIRKLLCEIKKIKRNLSLTMKAVKIKLHSSLRSDDSKSALNQIRRGIFFDLSNILGQAIPQNLYSIGNKIRKSDLRVRDENADSENENNYVPTPQEPETSITRKTISPGKKKYELRKSSLNISKNISSSYKDVPENDNFESDFSDGGLPSDNPNSDPDFCGDITSDNEEDDEECSTRNKRVQNRIDLSTIVEEDELAKKLLDGESCFSKDFTLPIKLEVESGDDPVGEDSVNIEKVRLSSGGLQKNENGSGMADNPSVQLNSHFTKTNPDENSHEGSSSICENKPNQRKKKNMKINSKKVVEMGACSYCGKLMNKNILTPHEDRHRKKNGEYYKCSHCGKGLPGSFQLKVHERLHTGEKPFVCEICGKGYTQSYYLKAHKRVHTGERCLCSICGKSFIHNKELIRHQKIHSGERPHVCSICGKSWLDKGDLAKHMRIHTGERPYVCDICGKTFIQSCYLNTHKKTHTGERNYKCTVCGNAFTFKSHLNGHMKIHTGEKSHKCEICGKFFRQRHTLRRHIRSHTGEKPYNCEFCCKVYADRYKLSKHIKKFHTDNQQSTE